MDILSPEEREEGLNNFNKYFENQFNDDKFIKLNEKNEIGLMGKKLNEEISKCDSFEKYLNYYNFVSKEYEHSKSFYKYIVKVMNKDFKLKIKVKENSSSEENSEEDEENSDDEKKKHFIRQTKNIEL